MADPALGWHDLVIARHLLGSEGLEVGKGRDLPSTDGSQQAHCP
jgi:hypothetical protein